eukprot:5089122-Prymnesium_polylepis.2
MVYVKSTPTISPPDSGFPFRAIRKPYLGPLVGDARTLYRTLTLLYRGGYLGHNTFPGNDL